MIYTMLLYAKANKKYMKNYDKSKEPSYLKYWGVDNLIGCVMSQKLPSGSFWRVEETFQYNEDSIKIYNGESEVGYFLEFDVHYPEELNESPNSLQFSTEIMKLGKVEKR